MNEFSTKEASTKICPIMEKIRFCQSKDCMAWLQTKTSSGGTGYVEYGYCSKLFPKSNIQKGN